MGLLKKWKKKKLLKKAIEEAICTEWYVTYQLADGTDGTLTILAQTEGQAMNMATEQLSKLGKPWAITSTSCL